MVLPWIGFGLALAGAVVGWVVAAHKAGANRVLENGMKRVAANSETVAEHGIALVKIDATLSALADGQRRLEAGQTALAADLRAHLDTLHPRGRAKR